MSTQNILHASVTNSTTIKRAGRRVAGSYGRATHRNRIIANRAVRRAAKAILRQSIQ